MRPGQRRFPRDARFLMGRVSRPAGRTARRWRRARRPGAEFAHRPWRVGALA
ncbi:MAG: hypothetical protein AVDCRST_MAG59-5311 [uncultured Thermomicrobiales bacterium]|uniref:Uncharacterized protein n=1 Tax=uncultured Thermomicrobiales bacterium TaxID=1645740 RepID=A0A6J4VTP7_9BACT|nr:MAG: hypothetical protein AVDCRST_MAG59-5311 [uncultured Thermomicrobiales bacterium]